MLNNLLMVDMVMILWQKLYKNYHSLENQWNQHSAGIEPGKWKCREHKKHSWMPQKTRKAFDAVKSMNKRAVHLTEKNQEEKLL